MKVGGKPLWDWALIAYSSTMSIVTAILIIRGFNFFEPSTTHRIVFILSAIAAVELCRGILVYDLLKIPKVPSK